MNKVQWNDGCSCCGNQRSGEVVVSGERLIVTEVDAGVAYAVQAMNGNLVNADSALVPGGYGCNKSVDDLAALGIEI